MAKKVKTNAMRALEAAAIPYTAYEYPHGKEAVDGVTVAKLLDQEPATVYKTLVATDTKGGYYVFCIPVDKELDLKKAAKAAGVKHIEMIAVKDIQKITGYVRGGCSPVGMKKAYPTFFQAEGATLPLIVVSAGKIGYQIELEPEALRSLVNGTFADLVHA